MSSPVQPAVVRLDLTIAELEKIAVMYNLPESNQTL